jgi:hypothetical protein
MNTDERGLKKLVYRCLSAAQYAFPDLFSILSGFEAVDFRGELEIFFSDAAGIVGPGFDIHAAPGEMDVGVMALAFGDCADAVDEIERLQEIGELEGASDVMLVDDLPIGCLCGALAQGVGGKNGLGSSHG